MSDIQTFECGLKKKMNACIKYSFVGYDFMKEKKNMTSMEHV